MSAPHTGHPPDLAGTESDFARAEHYRRQLETIAQNATLALFILDEHQRCTYMNPAAERLTGYTLSDVQGKALHDVIHHTRPDGTPYPLEECPIDQAFPQNMREQGEEVFVHRDGHFYPVAFTASPILQDGRPVGTIIEAREVSEERRARREAALAVAVGEAVTRAGSLREILQRCADAVVEHLDAAFARVWTLNEAEQVLELQASAGMYTHLDGPHGRVPVGKYKIGLIAREQAPHLTNDVPHDPRVSDQAWARREGLVAFAGYPLLVEGRTVGVLAMFARRALPERTLDALGAIADGIALAIDRNRVNAEVAASRARLQATIDSSLDAIVTTDARSIILEWSDHAESMFGWPASEAIGKRLADTIIPPQHREQHDRGMERYLSTGEGSILNRRIEITALRRDGREFPVELTVAAADAGGQVVFTAFLRDLTETNLARSLRAAEHGVTRVLAESRTMQEAAPPLLAVLGEALGWHVGVFWIPDPAANVLRPEALWWATGLDRTAFSAATRDFTFAPGVGLPGRVWADRCPSWISDVESDANFPRRKLALDSGLHGGFAFPVLSGETVVGVVEFFHRERLRPSERLLQSVEVVGRDIAQAVERVRAEAERDRAVAQLHEVAAERRAVLQQITEGVVVADADGVIIFMNSAAERLHGVSRTDVSIEDYCRTSRFLSIAGEPESAEALPLARALRRGEVVHRAEFLIDRPDGRRIIVHASATPVAASDGRNLGAVMTIRDTTGEVTLRRELELERERLQEIFTRAPALIAVTEGPEHRVVLVNPAYQRMAGERELVGRTLREALPELEGQGFFEMRDRIYATGEAHAQNEARVLADLDGDGRAEEVWLNFLTQPLRNLEGAVTGILTFAVDVSEQVRSRNVVEDQAAELETHAEQLQQQATQLEESQAELEMLNDELRASNRDAESARAVAEAANQAKSQFLANMSHELRTPINAIVGYSDLLAMGVTGPVTAAQTGQLERIRSSSRHLLMLIEDVLDLSKIEAGGIKVASERGRVRDQVSASIALVEPQAAAKGIRITDRCRREADHFFIGDEDRVRQIMTNLLSNAVKFTGEGGAVTVSCEIREKAEAGARLRGKGPWLCLRVEDTGIGISPEGLQAVFEPFVQIETDRTRARGGTGLGLTISRQLARLMRGDLTVRSEPGQGSCFTLHLPTLPPS